MILSDCESIGDAEVVALQSLSPSGSLAELNLSGTRITDDAISALSGMQIKNLGLNETAVTDAMAAELVNIGGLTHISLIGTAVTDRTCEQLSALEKLLTLTMTNTAITDEGARHLANIDSLIWLNLTHTDIGDQTLESFQRHDALHALQISKTNSASRRDSVPGVDSWMISQSGSASCSRATPSAVI